MVFWREDKKGEKESNLEKLKGGKMRKYYLEIESYRNDNSLSGIEIINQATKNRRERFAKTLKNLRLDFFEVDIHDFMRIATARNLAEASVKLMNLEIKDFWKSSKK